MIDLDILEPITYDNISELKAGDWIWDNKTIERRIHKRSLGGEYIFEPIGFRQIDIIDHDDVYISKLFMLSSFDRHQSGYFWEYFELGRFYKFRKGE